MNEKINISPDKILKGSENYILWYDTIISEIKKLGLFNLIKEDILEGIDTDNPPEKNQCHKTELCSKINFGQHSIIINSQG